MTPITRTALRRERLAEWRESALEYAWALVCCSGIFALFVFGAWLGV